MAFVHGPCLGVGPLPPRRAWPRGPGFGAVPASRGDSVGSRAAQRLVLGAFGEKNEEGGVRWSLDAPRSTKAKSRYQLIFGEIRDFVTLLMRPYLLCLCNKSL